MAESEKCVELALNSSLGKQKVMHILFSFLFIISSDICSTIALLTVFETKIEGIIGVVTCSGERSKISIDLDSISAHLLHEREGFRKG